MAILSQPKLIARAQSAPWWAAVEILLMEVPLLPSHKRKVITSMDAEEFDPGVRIDPTLRLDLKDAQTLMDDLWQCGIRPTEGVDNPGELKATKYHLEDMRKIAFGGK